MGLLDLQTYSPGAQYLSPEQRQDASTMGWLNTASALANASAPRVGPQASLLQLITGGAQAYGSGASEYQKMLADQYKQSSEMKRGMAMDQFTAENADQIRKQYNLPAGMPIDPKMLAEMASKAGIRNAENQSDLQFKPQIAGATKGAELPFIQQQAGYQSGLDFNKDSQLAKLRSGLELSNQFAFDKGKIREVAPGATLVGNGIGGLSDFYKNPNPAPGTQEGGIDKWYAEKFTGIQDSSISSQALLQNMKTMDSALNGIETGKYGNTALDIKKGLSRAGITLDVPDNLGKQEAAQALSRQMALQLRNPANGAGMPGAMSDADRNYLESIVPGLETTESGRKMIIDTQQKLTERSNEVAKLARDYRAKNNNKLDDGFMQELQDYSSTHNMFGDKQPDGIKVDGNQPRMRVFNPQTGKIE